MPKQRAVLQTIGSIYAAPGSSALWSKAIKETTELVGGKIGAYMLINSESMSTDVMAVAGLPPNVDASVYSGANSATKDIRFQYMHNLLPGQVFREFEFVPDRAAYEASEWIQHQRKHWGVFWCMSAQISAHGLWRDIISVNRLYDKGPHTDEEKTDLQAMLPHLSRAAELHVILTSLESRHKAVLAVLDKLLVGLIILDNRGRLALANSSARETCETSGCISISRDGLLQAQGVRNNDALRTLIAETGNTANGSGSSPGGRLILPKRSGGGHVLIEVMPIRDDGISDREGIQGTALFLIDPDSSQILSIDGLARIFSLTSSEQTVARLLVNGASVNKIAEERSASVETVRTQLKKVFLKTGTNSQLELMRLAVRANPPIGN